MTLLEQMKYVFVMSILKFYSSLPRHFCQEFCGHPGETEIATGRLHKAHMQIRPSFSDLVDTSRLFRELRETIILPRDLCLIKLADPPELFPRQRFVGFFLRNEFHPLTFGFIHPICLDDRAGQNQTQRSSKACGPQQMTLPGQPRQHCIGW
jgi:hypothetical protein